MMKGKIISLQLLVLIALSIYCASCDNPQTTIKEKQTDVYPPIDTVLLNKIYLTHKEKSLFNRRFKHADLDSLLKSKKDNPILTIDLIGHSNEGRSISEVTFGTGKTKILMWSQMHGDEPTATMALFDLFNFFQNATGEAAKVRELLNSKLNIHCIPMLNPDGAEIYFRRNAQSIDLNRDARAGQTTEGKILLEKGRSLKPDYAFNLHDQNIYYHVPNTQNPVTIALLAPAFDEQRSSNENRAKAMRIIVGINKVVNKYLPKSVARYNDHYSPRGFGDKFQSWGSSTILIESGGLKEDPEKQTIRKLNFVVLLNALIEIAQGSYNQYSTEEYNEIPFNGSNLLHDVVIKNINIQNDLYSLRTDMAIRRSERTVGRDFYSIGKIEDIGDLSESFGYTESEDEGLIFVEGKVLPRGIDALKSFTREQAISLLKKGYIAVGLKKPNESKETIIHDLPINVFNKSSFVPTKKLNLGVTANFFLADQSGILKYAVVNGYLIDLYKDTLSPNIRNRVYD